jgi:eukaryotic-like serine/threonine-protein kinase
MRLASAYRSESTPLEPVPQTKPNSWEALEALERTLGAVAVAGMSFRPTEVRGTGTIPLPQGDPPIRTAVGDSSAQSTMEWLEQARTEAPTTLAGERFTILDKIGEGGMGVVYKAVQASLAREVAVKQVTSNDPRLIAHFLSEAHVMGRLEHANILPVHLLGPSPDGLPQIAMKLVKGGSWRDLIHGPKAEGVDLGRHLQILLSVCNAMEFAHERGVLHRDLKPDNVMVGGYGEVFVMDWGVAVALDRSLADEGGILHVSEVQSSAGTPGYMAPELAWGRGAEQGVHTDVYLLGACLHEVLTRKRRHTGATMIEILQSASSSLPVHYGDDVPRELADICNRATAKEPGDRFSDVASFRRAIQAFLEHREAHAMVEKGLTITARVLADVARFGAAPQGDKDEIERAIHRGHTEARFAFEHALGLLPGSRAAEEGLRRVNQAMVEHAVATEDLALATRLLPECQGDARAQAAIAALKERLGARAHEVEALRETARRLDWAPIASPLGNTFLLGGVVGGVLLLAARRVADSGIAYSALILFGIWLLFAGGLGLYALLRLRRTRVPDSLLSPRMVGTWAAVAVSAIAGGVINELREQPPYHNICDSSLMIAIGFVAMAFQTRRWLLAPAVAFYLGAMVIALVPHYNTEIFAVIWLLGMGGVGLAFKLGATLEAGKG